MGNKPGSPVGHSHKKTSSSSSSISSAISSVTSPITSPNSNSNSNSNSTNLPYNPVISGPFPPGTFQAGTNINNTTNTIQNNNNNNWIPGTTTINSSVQPQNCKYFLNGYCRNGTSCLLKHDYSIVKTNVNCPVCGTNITGVDPSKIRIHFLFFIFTFLISKHSIGY